MTDTKYELCLFIAGPSIASDQALENIQFINSTILENKCDITVVDLQKDPSLARKHHIIAIPTLQKLTPHPESRVVGDLSMTEEVLAGLGISHKVMAKIE